MLRVNELQKTPSTFFPKSWLEARLNYELTTAFNDRKPRRYELDWEESIWSRSGICSAPVELSPSAWLVIL
jgi:hypothetical protein